MFRTLLCVGLCVLALGVAAESLVLFDFEDASELDRLTPNTKATISTEWASQGASSLKVEFPAYVAGETPDYPQVACWDDKIPMRDWRPYRFYSVDVHVPEEDTYLGVIVQRSKERRNRMDRRYTLAKGTFRLWLNIENAVAHGKDLDSIAEVFELEFFQSKPAKASVLYLDNIRLTKAYDTSPDAPDAVWLDAVQALAETPPPGESQGPGLDRIVKLDRSPLDERAKRIAVLDGLAKDIRGRAATETLAQAIYVDFAEYGYGVMSAPVEEHVFFENQGVQETWKRSLEMDVLRGEVRSNQVILFPKPGETLKNVQVEMSDLHGRKEAVIAASQLSLEMVGYVYLAESAMNRFQDFTDFGWYPDPVLTLEQPFDIVAPRQLQPLLWTIRTPRDAVPGRYAGTLTVAPAGHTPYTLNVAVTVHEAAMPVTCQLPHLVHCGLEALFPEFRLNPNNGELGSIYRWGSAVDPEQIEAFVERGMNRFNLLRISQFNIAARCGKRGEEAGAQGFIDIVTGIYTDDVLKELARRGLTDKAVFYGFDEVDVENPEWRGRIERVFGGLKEHYGEYGIKTATTARTWANPAAWDLPVDIWIPLLNEYDPILAKRARERSIEVWWYSISWEMFHAPLWSKALFWASYANDVDGWLYYHLYDWCDRDQRLADGNPLTSWSPQSEGTRGSYGTGAVVYWDRDGAPRPSLRLVNLREGLFDYDLLCMLRDRIGSFKATHPAPTFEEDLLLARASEVAGLSWRTTLLDYVLDPTPESATVIERSIRDLRAEALGFLGALGVESSPVVSSANRNRP
jgi:Glycoside hydrolase 123 N-terminal domain/Glycoside hydrolase 123, catalytic domain